MQQIVQLTDPRSVLSGTWQSALPEVLAGRDALVGQQARTAGAWGLDAAIDLSGCEGDMLRDVGTLKAFALALCDQLGVRPCGGPMFHQQEQENTPDAWTLLQGTSTGHLAAQVLTQAQVISLNVLSCLLFAPYQVAAWCQTWFGARQCQLTITLRGWRPVQAALAGERRSG